MKFPLLSSQFFLGNITKDHSRIPSTRWWFQIFFYFQPESLGKWSNLTSIFFTGVLKPPTSKEWGNGSQLYHQNKFTPQDGVSFPYKAPGSFFCCKGKIQPTFRLEEYGGNQLPPPLEHPPLRNPTKSTRQVFFLQRIGSFLSDPLVLWLMSALTSLRSTSIQEVEEGFRFLHLVPRSPWSYRGWVPFLGGRWIKNLHRPPQKSTQITDFRASSLWKTFFLEYSQEFVIAGLRSFPWVSNSIDEV